MKQEYKKPVIMALDIQQIDFVCLSNEVIRTDGDSEFDYGGSGNVPAQVRGHSVWDEE